MRVKITLAKENYITRIVSPQILSLADPRLDHPKNGWIHETVYVDHIAESKQGDMFTVHLRDPAWQQNGLTVVLSKDHIRVMEIVGNSPASVFDPEYEKAPVKIDPDPPALLMDFRAGDRTAYLEMDQPADKKPIEDPICPTCGVTMDKTWEGDFDRQFKCPRCGVPAYQQKEGLNESKA